MSTSPQTQSPELTLDAALTLQSHGFTVDEIVAHYPNHAKELRELLLLPPFFSTELENSVPDKKLLRKILDNPAVPKTPVQKTVQDIEPVRVKRPSLFSLLTFYINDGMKISKYLIWGLGLIFLVAGIILYRQLHAIG